MDESTIRVFVGFQRNPFVLSMEITEAWNAAKESRLTEALPPPVDE